MAEDPQPGTNEEEDEVAPTPFDNPFFLPVVLGAFSLWFIYDGWFNPEMEWIQFNRYGAGIAVALTAWYARKAFQERAAERAAENPDPEA